MFKDFTYSEVVAKADEIKAILGGGATVYLRDQYPPYEKACDFEPGCTIRLGMHVSGYFTAVVKGVRCRWNFDLEEQDANGTGALSPRTKTIREIMGKLEGKAKQQFREWLAEIAAAMHAEAADWRSRADAYAVKGATLADIAREA